MSLLPATTRVAASITTVTTAAAIGTDVVILMLGIDEEVVGEILLGEEAVATRVHHVETRQAAELGSGGGHGAVAEGGLRTKLRGSTFVILGTLEHLEQRILRRVQR